MCHVAASALLQGKNVLYITLEMAEEKIAERIDANLLNIPIQKLTDLPKVMFDKKIKTLSKKTQGKLIIKEYPTASAHVGHFNLLLVILLLSGALNPILSLLITLISVRPNDIKAALSTPTHMSKQSLRNLEVLLASVMFLSSLLHRPLVQVTVALMLILLILVNPLVFLLLLILCLPLLARKNLRA